MRKGDDNLTEQVKALREQTGAGVMECKRALQEAGGRIEEAVRLLRARGAAIATEKAGRKACEGLIGSYVHGGRIGVLVEVNCETDFAARTDAFKQLVLNLCLQIASMNPSYVTREEVPPEEIGRELEQLQEEIQGVEDESSQPIQQAHMEQFYKERVLLDQAFVKDPARTVRDLIHEVVASTRENIAVRRFVRLTLGEAPEAGPSGS